MTTKIIDDDKERPVPVTGDWLTASSRFSSDLIDELTGRRDVTVRVAPKAGHGHPACFFPELAVIEADGDLLGVDPASVRPDMLSDRRRYPAFSGLLAHEAGHARHSVWFTGGKLSRQLSQDQLPWLSAALLLEEAREESRQLASRPQDQPFLQASATEIVAAQAKQMLAEGLSRPDAGTLAALILARLDAGSVVRSAFTDQVEQAVRQVFADDYPLLHDIWQQVLEVADDDRDMMLELGRRWCELTGMAADGEIVIELSPEQARQLQDALDGLAADSRDEASGEAERRRIRVRIERRARDRVAEANRCRRAREDAARVFTANPVIGDRTRNQVITGWRGPSAAELGLAAKTRRALLAACVPDKAVVAVRSQRPGGRLLTREARRVQLQQDLDVTVTARPFLRREMESTITPPLRVAIIQDVSGSQANAAQAAAEGAWCLARAVRDIPRAQVGMLAFGNYVTPVVTPGRRLAHIPQVSAANGSHRLSVALSAAEGQLMLLRRSDARLVVIITDGVFEAPELDARDPALTRLTEAGVRVLWFASDGKGRKYLPKAAGVRVITQYRGDPQSIPAAICAEAVKTLEAVR